MRKFAALILTVFTLTACGPSVTDIHNIAVTSLQATYDAQGELLDVAFANGPEVAPDIDAIKYAAIYFETQADLEYVWFTETEFPEKLQVYQKEYNEYYLSTVDDYVALVTIFVEDLESAEDATTTLFEYVGDMTEAEGLFADAFNRLGDTMNINATE